MRLIIPRRTSRPSDRAAAISRRRGCSNNERADERNPAGARARLRLSNRLGGPRPRAVENASLRRQRAFIGAFPLAVFRSRDRSRTRKSKRERDPEKSRSDATRCVQQNYSGIRVNLTLAVNLLRDSVTARLYRRASVNEYGRMLRDAPGPRNPRSVLRVTTRNIHFPASECSLVSENLDKVVAEGEEKEEAGGRRGVEGWRENLFTSA